MLGQGIAEQHCVYATVCTTTGISPDGGAGNEDHREGIRKSQEGDGENNVVVGFAFMSKKMDSMSKIVAIGPCDGVEFRALDFSDPPDRYDEKNGRQLDVIAHKLSDDIMFRDVQAEGDRRLRWMEKYLASHPRTLMLDPIRNVSKVINRITTLQLLDEAYNERGREGGMPRPPRFLVLEKGQRGLGDAKGPAREKHLTKSLTFPVICKPIEACGSRGSHRMVVVLDEAGMVDLPSPIVVQEYRNHGGLLFKVCVIGDDVRVYTRPSLPDLPQDLTGSFTFDSQKPYPTWAEVERISAVTAESRRQRHGDEVGTSKGKAVCTDEDSKEISRTSEVSSREAPTALLNRSPNGLPNGCHHEASTAAMDGSPDGSITDTPNLPSNGFSNGCHPCVIQREGSKSGVGANGFRGGPEDSLSEMASEDQKGVEAACGWKRKSSALGGNSLSATTPCPNGKSTVGSATDAAQRARDIGTSLTSGDGATTLHNGTATSDVRATSVIVQAGRYGTEDTNFGNENAAAPRGLSPLPSPNVPSRCPPSQGLPSSYRGVDCNDTGNWGAPCQKETRVARKQGTTALLAGPSFPFGGGPKGVSGSRISLEAARVAAMHMRETFGLSIFGFDLIVDSASGEPMVIDVNYFPSFKDLTDFPDVLRRRLKEMVADAKSRSVGFAGGPAAR